MKIIFMGTPEFGAIILENLIKADFKPYSGRWPVGPFRPILVVTEPDKPVGRKQMLTPPPVKLVAQKYKIAISQPEKISNLKSEILSLKSDLIIVAAYGQIIPKDILDIPKYGSLNLHPSLLPKYRGPSPIQYTILNGDKETGVTIILMDEKIDHGPILAQRELVNYELGIMNYEKLNNELAKLGVELLIETIPKWVAGEIKPLLQDDSKAIYTKTLKRDNGRIDWKKSAEEIERQIRAFDPWPGSYCLWSKNNEKPGKNLRVKILKVSLSPQKGYGPFGIQGKTFLAPDNRIAVQTGKDYLIIEELQLEGGKSLSAEEFLRGYSDFVGKILE